MTAGKMAVYWSFAMWAGFMGGAFALLGGCGGATTKDDLFGNEAKPDEPQPKPVCNPVAVSCNGDENKYSSESACKSAGNTSCRYGGPDCDGEGWCGRIEAQCTAVPVCDKHDEEVTECVKGASCYERTACGATITCQRPFAQCNAIPSCDPGDVPAVNEEACKKAGTKCYSRTLCGETILCIDK